MNTHDQDRIQQLLRQALPPMQQAEPGRDLWPAVLKKLEPHPRSALQSVPLLDWALAGGLLAFAAIAPMTIPVLLYYL
jgi:hypothetical protein